MTIKPETATKAEMLIEADRLLEIGVRAEVAGKSETMVNLAMKKALGVENQEFDVRK